MYQFTVNCGLRASVFQSRRAQRRMCISPRRLRHVHKASASAEPHECTSSRSDALRREIPNERFHRIASLLFFPPHFPAGCLSDSAETLLDEPPMEFFPVSLWEPGTFVTARQLDGCMDNRSWNMNGNVERDRLLDRSFLIAWQFLLKLYKASLNPLTVKEEPKYLFPLLFHVRASRVRGNTYWYSMKLLSSVYGMTMLWLITKIKSDSLFKSLNELYFWFRLLHTDIYCSSAFREIVRNQITRYWKIFQYFQTAWNTLMGATKLWNRFVKHKRTETRQTMKFLLKNWLPSKIHLLPRKFTINSFLWTQTVPCLTQRYDRNIFSNNFLATILGASSNAIRSLRMTTWHVLQPAW